MIKSEYHKKKLEYKILLFSSSINIEIKANQFVQTSGQTGR